MTQINELGPDRNSARREVMNESQLITAIKAHIAKGDKAAEKSEQHYIAAGQHLKTLKAQHDDADGTWAEWEALLKEKIGIGKSRASELMQIADGRKTVEAVRADTAKRTADAKAALKLSASSGESAGEPESDGSPLEAEGFVDGDGNPIPLEKVEEERVGGPDVAAALRMVQQMSEEARQRFFDEFDSRYPEDCGHRIYEDSSDSDVVRTIVAAIGAERARALGKKIPRLVLEAAGKVALPDCPWCSGGGLVDAEMYGNKIKAPCECTRRKRGEDVAAILARAERENKEMEIPQQDFSFGLEVTTKDGKLWASGVRLPTKEEAEFYIDYWARHQLRTHGYVTWENDPNCDLVSFEIKQHDEQPRMKITGGKRKTLHFLHGTCGLLGWKGWRPIAGGECECKKCEKARRFSEEIDLVARAYEAGEISDKQYNQWFNHSSNKRPKWLEQLLAAARAAPQESSAGNAADDPASSAEAMKEKIAALDGSDPGPIPKILQRRAAS